MEKDEQEVRNRYKELMFSGAQTQEKHVRYVAEELVKAFNGGFASGSEFDISRRRKIAWETERDTVFPAIIVPAGLHGFALQMVIEEQIRGQIKP